ncbi:MAG: nicotinate-nucleotide--dimethylbenzimidazole phosphoribosyltransferase [bacterium]
MVGEMIQEQWDSLMKPPGSLGQLETVLRKIGKIQKTSSPTVRPASIQVFAGDHGVTEENVSAYPPSVTEKMISSINGKEAAVSVLAEWANVSCEVWNVGSYSDWQQDSELVANGTKNIRKSPAMNEEQLNDAINVGRHVFHESKKHGHVLVGLGEIGIGNTTPSSVLSSVFLERPPESVVGPGTGLSEQQISRKIEVVHDVIKMHELRDRPPRDVLRCSGGFEHAAHVGLLLEATKHDVPVVLDGVITASSLLVAHSIESDVKEVVIPGHRSPEPAHSLILEYLDLAPLLELDMRLGEGTGAVLAMNIMEAAHELFNCMGRLDKVIEDGATNR